MTIHSYDYIPDKFNFLKTNDDEADCMYLGVELEVDEGGESEIEAERIEDFMGENNVYIMHDGSLNDGLEIVTHPATFNYHKTMNYKELFKLLIEDGYKGHDSGRAGLHVHVNRNYLGKNNTDIDLTIAKLLYIIEKHWDNITLIARRGSNRYSDRYGYVESRSLFDYLVMGKQDGWDYHKYRPLNLCHSNTIEFRMFRSTLVYSTFMATLEFVINLVSICRNSSLDKIQEISFYDILNYKPTMYLLAYYQERLDKKAERERKQKEEEERLTREREISTELSDGIALSSVDNLDMVCEPCDYTITHPAESIRRALSFGSSYTINPLNNRDINIRIEEDNPL